jgi:glutamate:GABA antiporter
MAASVIGLNREMPLEGGLYVWAHRAFGDLGGFLTAWNILIYAIAVTAAILYAIPTEIAYFIGPSAAWLPENRLISLAIVTAMVAGVTLAAIPGLDVGKWVQNIGGMAILAVFAVLIVLPIGDSRIINPSTGRPFRSPLRRATCAPSRCSARSCSAGCAV